MQQDWWSPAQPVFELDIRSIKRPRLSLAVPIARLLGNFYSCQLAAVMIARSDHQRAIF
jgi:hypothetical protein